MPKLRKTPQQKEAERIASANRAVQVVLNHYKIDGGFRWEDVASNIGTSLPTLSRWRSDPGGITLDALRSIVKVTGLSPEDWLAIGGFERGV